MAKLPKKPRRCFVVGPIGGDDSDERIHADWLLEEIIQPVFEEHFEEFTVVRADKITEPGQIDAQVIEELLDADLVIADLTTLNPNAFYEIGIRHMVGTPIIHMHLEGEKIPFDVGSYRSIKFSRKRPRDLKEARVALEKAVTAAMKDGHHVDNPVTAARGKIQLRKNASSTEKVLLDEIATLSSRLKSLEAKPTFVFPEIGYPDDHWTRRNREEKPPKGQCRITLTVEDPTDDGKLEEYVKAQFPFEEAMQISSTRSAGLRRFDIPKELVSKDLVGDLSASSYKAGIKASVMDEDGGWLLVKR